MPEILLFISFINLTAILPLFAGYSLAGFMSNEKNTGIWEKIISSPMILCTAVIFMTSLLAWRLARNSVASNKNYLGIIINGIVMWFAWCFPELISTSPETKHYLLEGWTVCACILLLLSSLIVPLQALCKIYLGKNSQR